MTVEEPTEEQAKEILEGVRPYYERHHGVEISDAALDAAVKMSTRYIHDRFLPDKAIDLMDETASRVQLGGFKVPASTAIPVSAANLSTASLITCPCGSVDSHMDQYTRLPPSPAGACVSAAALSPAGAAVVSAAAGAAAVSAGLEPPPHAVSEPAIAAVSASAHNFLLFI